mgnify:CR=1 FL=1
MSKYTQVIMVYQMDPFGEDQGGGTRYVKQLLEGLSKTNCKIDFLGQGVARKSQRSLSFIPISHTHCSYPVFFLKLLFFCLKQQPTTHSVVHVHRLYFALPFILLWPQAKIICTLHGRSFSVFPARFGKAISKVVFPVFKTLERFLLRRIDALIPVSHEVSSVFANRYKLDYLDSKLNHTFIPSMVDLSSFFPFPSTHLQNKFGEKHQYITFIGRLAAVKNITKILNCWAEESIDKSKFKLVLVGDGELKKQLLNITNQLDIEKSVIFYGAAPPRLIPEIINSSHGLVLSSYHEASPTVVKESLACGVPILSTDVGEVSDYINHKKTGYIVECNDSELDYVVGMEWLLNSKFDKLSIVKMASNRLKQCSPEICGKMYAEAYQKLLPSKKI